MKIRDIIKIVALSAVVIFTSCDDFLDQESQSQASTGQMYTSILDCEYGLAAMYNALKAPNVHNIVDELVRSDMATQGNRTNLTSNAYMQDFTNAITSASNKWAALYQVVFRANQLLEGVEKLSKSLTTDNQVEKLNSYRAQAHFIRGLAYMWLHNSYNGGSVPLVTKASTTPEDIYVPCSTHEEVRSFYREDLRAAAFTYGDYMYDSWDDAPDWTGIATRQAAYAFLGQSYLYEAGYLDNGHGDSPVQPSQGSAAGAYEMAAKYFEMIIDEGKYSLVDADILGTMTNDGEFNDESIFEVNYTTEFNSDFTSVNNYLYNTFNMNLSSTGYASAVPAMWLADVYDTEVVDPMQESNWFDQELDADGDLVFKLGGKTFEVVTNSGTEIETVTYVYQTSKDLVTGLPLVETRSSDGNNYLVFESNTGTELCKKIRTATYAYDEAQGDNVWTYVTEYDEKTLNRYNQEYVGPGEHETENVRVYASAGDPESWEVKTLRKITPRKAYTIGTPHCTELPYYLDPIWFISNFNNYSVGYFRWMTNWETVGDEDDTVPTQTSGINLRIMRLADVYLMYAECLAELGVANRGRGTALDFINKIRYRAGSTLMGQPGEFAGQATYDGKNYSDNDIIEHLRWKERPMEFSVEGHAMRVCDLRRWNVQQERFVELSNYTRYRGNIYVISKSAATGMLSTATKTIGTYTWEERQQIWAANEGWEEYWGHVQVADYVDAAKNFIWKDNSYWPIPNNEVLANPYID